jgi:uncharacterized protein (DUF4213/DUF364 family)
MIPILEKVKNIISELVSRHQLGSQRVQVTVKALSPKQAIGSPSRQDFPILEGKEVIVEAQFGESFGQAFTDQPQSFSGTIDEVLALNLDTSGNRAVFISSLNAITSHLGIATGVRHCRDDEPERCGLKIAYELKDKYGDTRIGMVGLQPAILQNLSQNSGTENVRCTDLNPKNIGKYKFGIRIWDGKTETKNLINWCHILFVTSSSITNGTFDDIHKEAVSTGKQLILFGITGAGVCALTGLERICPFGH